MESMASLEQTAVLMLNELRQINSRLANIENLLTMQVGDDENEIEDDSIESSEDQE
jgi:hypothetical protein